MKSVFAPAGPKHRHRQRPVLGHRQRPVLGERRRPAGCVRHPAEHSSAKATPIISPMIHPSTRRFHLVLHSILTIASLLFAHFSTAQPTGVDPVFAEWQAKANPAVENALTFLQHIQKEDGSFEGTYGDSTGVPALVGMAFDSRFALVLVGSSGEGGAKLHRRNFGEAVENLTGSGEYHWMAGNFLKYGTAESTFGSKNADDLPVDAHTLIALCAPRFTFISYGIPERGDANWLDQRGSYMATVAAGSVFRLLGVKDLGVKEDYRTAKMPPVNTGLLDGELAWRQHDGGHEDRSNMKYFIAWASKLIHHPVPAPATAK